MSLLLPAKAHWRLLLLVLLLGLGSRPGRAQNQPGRPGAHLGQIENAKIAFISGRLSLTQDQAQRFWPLYNEFSTRRRELGRAGRQLRRADPNTLSDQQVRDNLNQALSLRQQELNLEKEYLDKFQKVISIKQVALLYQAERDFTKEVIKRVADRRGGEGAVGAASGED